MGRQRERARERMGSRGGERKTERHTGRQRDKWGRTRERIGKETLGY